MSNGGIDMMDEFENNRENEHVDQTPHAETPYDTGDGNTDNLKRTARKHGNIFIFIKAGNDRYCNIDHQNAEYHG